MKWRAEQCEAFVLCGGSSRRMSYPKEMLRVEGRPLAVAMVERLQQLFEKVSLVTDRPYFLRHLTDVPICSDIYKDSGPLAGIHAGLSAATASRAFFLACDMPLVHNDFVRRLVEQAQAARAHALVPYAFGRRQPLCAVYDRSLLAAVGEYIEAHDHCVVNRFLDKVRLQQVQVTAEEARALRDLDRPGDVDLLHGPFADVEPLPVARLQLQGPGRHEDTVAQEWPLSVFVNGRKLVTALCLPTAVRELAVGMAEYLGLAETAADVRNVDVDYAMKRVDLHLNADDDAINRAAMLLVTSTCGANVYGPRLPSLDLPEVAEHLQVRRSEVLSCLRAMRPMAPAFSVTGGTHQAAFCIPDDDQAEIRYFFEDIGRHNALDKVLGQALLEGTDLSQGFLISTGRLSSEMVVKAVRARAPVLASRSAVTTNAVRLARAHGLTLVGFARGERMNTYSGGERVIDA